MNSLANLNQSDLLSPEASNEQTPNLIFESTKKDIKLDDDDIDTL